MALPVQSRVQNSEGGRESRVMPHSTHATSASAGTIPPTPMLSARRTGHAVCSGTLRRSATSRHNVGQQPSTPMALQRLFKIVIDDWKTYGALDTGRVSFLYSLAEFVHGERTTTGAGLGGRDRNHLPFSEYVSSILSAVNVSTVEHTDSHSRMVNEWLAKPAAPDMRQP